MAQEDKTLLESFSVYITYTPLEGEVALDSLIPQGAEIYAVPADHRTDPKREAAAAISVALDRTTCVLTPGTRFDLSGTRHGRGGGWYDRFLAEVPAEWLRIGLCYPEQLSPEPLVREPWDQPVDYIGVVNRETNEVEWNKTNARL